MYLFKNNILRAPALHQIKREVYGHARKAEHLTSKLNGLLHFNPLRAGKSHQRPFLSSHQTHRDGVTRHILTGLHCNHTKITKKN